MAELAVSFVKEKLLLLLRDEANLPGGMHKEFANMKEQLEVIQAFLKDADRRAAAEGGNSSEGVRTWVKELREVAFRIEDIIDEYLIYVGEEPCHFGCEALLCEIVNLITTLIPRHRIALEIQDIKSSILQIKERSERYGFQIQFPFEEGPSSSPNVNVKWRDPRMASLFLEEAELVGLEAPRGELIGWLVGGATTRTVISVVGTGGVGKTTLAKKVFDNHMVTAHFDCHAWITVSDTYTVDGLLRNMLDQFYHRRGEDRPRDISKMDWRSLTNEVRNYLQLKRYVIVFDDVWKVGFWSDIEFAVLDNKNGSRILITTRQMEVGNSCERSSIVHFHELQPLPLEKSWELFCKHAFRFTFDGLCPEELKDISFEIVKKCKGLPLAIVAIAGFLSTRIDVRQFHEFFTNLSLELQNNPHLSGIIRILALDYDDLPYYFKPCFLYFAIYPEDYSIDSVRLIKQWIAEGLVKYQRGKTLEEVAEKYLAELISRSLVQASDVDHEGKVRRCRVHYQLMREMILEKMKDLSFCHFVSTTNDNSNFSEIIPRLAITMSFNNFMGSVESSSIRSLHIFGDGESDLSESFVRKIPEKYRLLKVLNFEDVPLNYVPDNLGDLFHLRHLSLRNTFVKKLPKSIGNLQNLEAIDLRGSPVEKLPREINKLRKLRHLEIYLMFFKNPLFRWQRGSEMSEGIGSLTSIQTLYFVDVYEGGVKLITELGKLSQLRHLGLTGVRQEYGRALCESINKLHNLETLDIFGVTDEVIDWDVISLPHLRQLRLQVKLEKLPRWIQNLHNLVELTLTYSELTDDPLKSLKNIPNLLQLYICSHAYRGECLHFEGGFQKLKVLGLVHLHDLNSIRIDEGALPSFIHLDLCHIPQLKEVPSNIQHLRNLEILDIISMPDEFEQSIDPDGGQQYWIIQHVPLVNINSKRIVHHPENRRFPLPNTA